MVSTSQAEAANGPTHATESSVAQRESSPSSPRNFVSFLISFRSFRFLQQPDWKRVSLNSQPEEVGPYASSHAVGHVTK